MLYLRVNEATTEDVYDFGGEAASDFRKLNVVWSEIDYLFNVSLYIDFAGTFGNKPIPAGTVIRLELGATESPIEADAVFDFG